MLFRARQVFHINDFSESNRIESFTSVIARHRPDTGTSPREDWVPALIEAYAVLRAKIEPSDCRLLEQNAIISSLLPKGVEPVELGTKYAT